MLLLFKESFANEILDEYSGVRGSLLISKSMCYNWLIVMLLFYSLVSSHPFAVLLLLDEEADC